MGNRITKGAHKTMNFNNMEELRNYLSTLPYIAGLSELQDLLDIAYYLGNDDGETTGYRNSMAENGYGDDEEGIRDEAYNEGYRDAETEGERAYKDGYDEGYEHGHNEGYDEGKRNA